MDRIYFVNIWLIILLLCSSCVFFGDSQPIGMDYRIFDDTPAEKAATALKRHNISMLKKELEKNPEILNLGDPYYGNTLLMLATLNNYYKGVSTLLECGADPNIVSDSIKHTGETALNFACQYSTVSSNIVRILLEHGADPNFVSTGETPDGTGGYRPYHCHVLNQAASEDLEKVKLLIEHGADISEVNLESSIILDKLDITLYLLEHGADYNKQYPLYADKDEWWDIGGLLKKNYYKPGTPEYAQKMKVVEFLKERGIDYGSAPVPDRVRKMIMEDYPDNYEYILSIY